MCARWVVEEGWRKWHERRGDRGREDVSQRQGQGHDSQTSKETTVCCLYVSPLQSSDSADLLLDYHVSCSNGSRVLTESWKRVERKQEGERTSKKIGTALLHSLSQDRENKVLSGAENEFKIYILIVGVVRITMKLKRTNRLIDEGKKKYT